jgi:hypothetical protein
MFPRPSPRSFALAVNAALILFIALLSGFLLRDLIGYPLSMPFEILAGGALGFWWSKRDDKLKEIYRDD